MLVFALLLVAVFLAGAFLVAGLVAVFFGAAFLVVADLVAVFALAAVAFFAAGLVVPPGAASFTGPDVPIEGGEVSELIKGDAVIGRPQLHN